jgi:uncharacterized protein (DUF924 family)
MTVSTQTVSAETIINFWFSADVRPNWFNASKEFDQQLRHDYESLLQQASNGELSSWQDSAQGCLALILILDQFPLNMFRGDARGFATESMAITICKHAIAQKFDHQFGGAELAFLYMPLMHSEELQDQDESVRLFTEAGLGDNARWAEHHREIIRRFGRFPHRNIILGRESSAEEASYLASDEAFQG